MSSVQTNSAAQVKSASIYAVVYRCRCGHPESHKGEICPMAVEERQGVDGLVAHTNSDPVAQRDFDIALARAEGRPVVGRHVLFSRWPTSGIRARLIQTLLKWRSKL